MDSSTTYLANNDVKDAAKTTVESGDEEIVVFANNSGNGPKSASKAADANGKVAPGTVEATEASVDASKVDGAVDNDSGANGLADAFGNLSVNPSAQPGVNFDYAARNDYRTPKYPSIAVSNGDVNPGPPGAEWQSGKGGRKPDDQYYGASNYARPLNATASDFQHRGPPNYGAYGAPGAAPYGSYQGVPAMHGSYANHSYDVFGASPTLTEPAVANGAPGAPGGVGNANGPNAPNNRYMGPNHRGSMNGEPAVLNIGAIGAAGGAPYSPLPLSPSPLTINPYAVHHHPQLQIPHINGHPMGYGPQSGPPPKNGAPGAPGSATSPGGNPTNGSGAEGGSPTSYRNLAFNMPWPNSPSEFYPESGMYANGYGAAHLPHGMPQSQYLTPQMGPPMPGTPQMGAPYGYMSPMPGAPGGPGMGVPGNHHANGVNGAHHQGGPRSAGGHNGAVHNGVGVSPTGAPPNVQVVNGLTLINGVPQPNADGTGPSANNRKLGLYKTELCRSWEEKGSCRYGPKCQFAHGEEEIRKVARHPKYKTEICRTFWLSGSCPYGKRCCFIHTDAPAGAATADPSKATAGGTGPSTAPNGATTPNGTAIDGSGNAGGHTRTTSSTSDAAEQPPSSLLARISAKRNVEDKTPPPTSGPARLAPNGAARPDYSSHNRHLSSMSDGRPTEVEAAPAFPTSRPGHSHSASAHTLMTPTFASPANGAVGGYGSNVGTPGVDGNGNLTPGSYWGHKRSASGGSATNGGWNTPTADVAAEQPPVRSIYSALTPSA